MANRMVFGTLLLSWASVFGTVSLAAGQNAVLYEVTEQMKVKRDDRVQARAAKAALMGWVSPGTSLCPDWLAAALQVSACAISATANDNISLATGQGPVRGKFAVLIPGDNAVDGPEFVVAEGSLRGTITGEWSARGSRGGPLDGLQAEGTLTGTFRLPFADPLLGAAYMLNPYAYPGPGSAVAVTKDELSLGVPTVRLELGFVDSAPGSARSARGRD